MNIAKLPNLLRKGQPLEGERAKLYAFFGRPKEDRSGSDTPRNACPKLASYGGDKAKPTVSTSGGFAVSGLPYSSSTPPDFCNAT